MLTSSSFRPIHHKRVLECAPRSLFTDEFNPSGDEDGDLLLGGFGSRISPTPTIEGYRIIKEIGRGGMGIVYKAVAANGDLVAVKVMHGGIQQEPEARRRFRREARIASRLQHPNVVRYREAGSSGAVDYFVMDFVEGTDLDRFIEENGPVSVERACSMLRQVALGLQHFADKGLVHRDIKPSNLILQHLTDEWRVVITDLGLALTQAGDGSSSQSLLTHVGLTMGTPDFIAPEQIENSHDVDIRADLYSLGCAFYYAICGRVPFPARSTMEKLERHRWAKPRSLDKVRRDVPSALAELIDKLMAKKPEDRFQTPAHLIQELDRVTDSPRAPAPSSAADKLVLAESLQWQIADLIEQGKPSKALPIVDQLLALRPNDSLAMAAKAFLESEVKSAEPPGSHGRMEGHKDSANAVAFLPNSYGVLSAGSDRRVVLWNEQGRSAANMIGHTDAAKGCAVSPDGRLALSGGKDKTMRLWDLGSGKELRSYRRHKASVQCVAFAPSGRQMVSGCTDGGLRLWDVDHDVRIHRLDGHHGDIRQVAFSRDGTCILSASWDHTVRVWDVANGTQLRCFHEGLDLLNCVSVCPDDMHAVIAGSHGCIYVWNFRDGRLIRTMHVDCPWINALALTPNGGQLIFGGNDELIRVCDFNNNVQCAWSDHRASITTLAVAFDGRMAASGASDGSVRLWRLP